MQPNLVVHSAAQSSGAPGARQGGWGRPRQEEKKTPLGARLGLGWAPSCFAPELPLCLLLPYLVTSTVMGLFGPFPCQSGHFGLSSRVGH